MIRSRDLKQLKKEIAAEKIRIHSLEELIKSHTDEIDELMLSIQRKETTLRTMEAPEEFYIPARKNARPKQELKILAFMGPRSNGE